MPKPYTRTVEHRKQAAVKATKHGRTGTPEYRAWSGMIQRCTNPEVESYNRYGGRGIKICDRWQEFENFLEDMGKRPSSAHSLERKDNSKNYYPENCIWATPKEQANNRRNNRVLNFNGKYLTLSQWADHLGIQQDTLKRRIDVLGWPLSRALTEPLQR